MEKLGTNPDFLSFDVAGLTVITPELAGVYKSASVRSARKTTESGHLGLRRRDDSGVANENVVAGIFRGDELNGVCKNGVEQDVLRGEAFC